MNNERERARGIRLGTLVRIAPGSYASHEQWRQLDPLARHAARVWETASRVADGTVFSHHAAAALHGLDTLGHWPERIDTIVSPRGGGRSTGTLYRHSIEIAGSDLQTWGRHFVTSPLRTVLDIGASRPFVEGVAIADRLLWQRNPRATTESLRLAASRAGGRGTVRLQRVAEFARAGSANVRESQSRVLIAMLGFPEPELQHRFVISNAAVYDADFFWPEHDHIGEFDGFGKYLDPAMQRGRTPQQVLRAEKEREDALRRIVRGFSRWQIPDLEAPERLRRILTGAGLPCGRPFASTWRDR